MDKEREKLKKLSTVITDVVTKGAQDFSVSHKFALDPDLGAYVLSIELQVVFITFDGWLTN